MTKIYLMKTGRTRWQEQDRLESSAGSPLTPQGAQFVCDIAEQLSAMPIAAIYAATGEAERETAGLLAGKLGLKVRTNKDLHEIDYGLWQGLTSEEIKRRNPKVYRQWTSAPTTVCPPDGETLDEAQRRVRKALEGILKRQKGKAALLVLRPVALALLRCLLHGDKIETVWKDADPSFTWCSYDVDINGKTT